MYEANGFLKDKKRRKNIRMSFDPDANGLSLLCVMCVMSGEAGASAKYSTRSTKTRRSQRLDERKKRSAMMYW